MRRTLSSFVAVLCLLTLFISSAACLAAALPSDALSIGAIQHQHTVNAPDHACCPQRSPANQHTSDTCCTVHHQPVSTVAVVELEQPGMITYALLPSTVQIVEAIAPSAGVQMDATQHPPLIALRI
jgi:hypothetical protein